MEQGMLAEARAEADAELAGGAGPGDPGDGEPETGIRASSACSPRA